MKRLLFILFCATASLPAFAQPQTSEPVADPNAPKITFEVMEYNFDSIVQGDTVKYTFKFKNTGKSPLLITDAQVGCGCTQPTYPHEPIAPGKSGTIYVEFRSAGKMGPQDKTITIVSNNGSGNVVLHLKGKVIAKAAQSASPTPGGTSRPGPVNK